MNKTGYRPLGAGDGVVFQPLSHQHDEHDFGGGEVFTDSDGSDGRDCDRKVRRQPTTEQVEHGLVDDLVARDNCDQKRRVEAKQGGKLAETVQQQ